MEQPLSRFKFALVLGFAAFINLFLFRQFGSLSFVSITAGMFVLAALFFPARSSTTQKTVVAAGALLTIVWISLLLRSNSFVQFIGGVTTFGILFYFLYLISRSSSFFLSLGEVVFAPLYLAGEYLQSLIPTVRLVTERSTNHDAFSRVKSVLIGIVIAVPIIAILISMLSSADPIYRKTVGEWFSGSFWNEAITRVVVSLIVLSILAPLTILQVVKTRKSPVAFLANIFFIKEATVVMTLITLTLISFLVIQWPYVFASVAAETDLSKFGVATYSEYVKRGFGEFLQIAALVYGLIWGGLLLMRGKDQKTTRTLRIVQLILLTVFFLFIVSIFRRIWLYQLYHGWSIGRLYGGFFLIWIAGMTGTLALRHLTQFRFIVLETTVSVVLLISFHFFNVEEFIVQNHPPTVNKHVDYVYLSRMSPDGYVGWQRAYEYASNVILTRNLQNKPFISRDERREVAYAGMIVTQLTRNYNRLIRQYGTEKELRTYLVAILTAEQARYQRYLSEPDRQYETNVATDQQQIKTNIDNYMGKVYSSRSDLITIANAVSLNYFSNANEFELLGHIQPMSFYFIDETYQFPSYTSVSFHPLDRLYTWHFGNIDAFLKMQEELSHKRLMFLQERYLLLFEKISNQPKDEKGFDFDISTDSPLLQSM
ncbi:DUF4173 domain-containing protein [Candidatus Roizmanbacteria bacterium]|nr:DUF4173 domain-containing protein [Candidatus Roizmanbacteria bacterium]